MVRKNYLPKFPDSYKGEFAKEYNNQKWMERNQKKTTLRCIEYLYDNNLGKNNIDENFPYLILDMGCGTGYSSEVLIDNGFRVIGIDVLPDMLLKANERKNVRMLDNLDLILADINYLPLRKRSIDHIISVSAYNFIIYGLEGTREERKVVNNTAKFLRGILKGKGRAIIEFYPQNESELDLFSSSFKDNGFDGYIIKNNPKQKAGQTFLLLKKEG
ncbi:MAG: class I SAM-dependent methyltransferase [Promethearchaeota archaeon]